MRPGLPGLRVFIVEDESLVALNLQVMLEDLQCEVADVASTRAEADSKFASIIFDAAILDVNLRGERSFPIAQRLQERGIPFVFATGYGTSVMPPEFRHVPVLSKPFKQADLAEALTKALA